MAKTVKIFCMGDSLTEGDGNSAAYRYQLFEKLWKSGISFRFSGPNLSRDDLRLPKLFSNHGGNCGFKIGGSVMPGGSLIGNSLKRPEYVQALSSADIVLLWIGTNDFGQKDDIEHIFDRYEKLLNIIWSYAPQAAIYGASLIYNNDEHRKFNKELAALAPEICRKTGKSFTYVDLGTYTSEEFQQGDGHPNEAGNIKIAQHFYDAIIDQVREINQKGVDHTEEPYFRADALKVYTKDALLEVGQSLTLKTDVFPANASVKTLVFDSSNSDVAEVDMYGAIHAKSEGEAVITVTALDGGMSERIRITVSGRQDLTDGMTQIYKSDMTKPENFEGNIAQINNPYNKFRVGYKSYQHTLRDKNFEFDGDKVLFRFKHFTSNHNGRNKNLYSSVMLGDLELRVGGLASYVMLYQNNKLVGAYSHLPRGPLNDEYAVSVADGSAEVYRNGELLFKTELDRPNISGGISLWWREYGCKTELRDIEIYK